MKKMISILLLACMLVMPFAAMAEADAEPAELELPEGWTAVEVSDEDAENGLLYAVTNGESVLTITLAATEGKTVEQLVEEAKADGMTEVETKNEDGANLIGFKSEVDGVVSANIALVYAEEGVMIVFSFTPCADEAAENAFAELVQFLAAQL
ncbi:MAG: hypothetical protein IJJ60_00340 [Clostridia bacterium]|nr:hypothetical protein [Clostridia bacterium]